MPAKKRIVETIKIGKVDTNFMKLLEPMDKLSGEGREFSVQLFWSNDDEDVISTLKGACMNVAKDAFPDIPMDQLNYPIRHADKEPKTLAKYPEMAGHMFMNVRRPESFGPPPIYGKDGKPMTGVSDQTVFSGCLVYAILDCYDYSVAGNEGVTFGLRAIQIADNVTVARRGGGVDPGSLFTAVDGANVETAGAAVEDDLGPGHAEPTEEVKQAASDIPW